VKRLAIAALFAAAACHHSAGSTTTVANQAGQPLQQRKIASDLELLPVDSEAVIGVNFQQLQGSALWQQYVVPKLASVPGIDKFKAICGFDPMQSLHTVVIGMSGIGGDSPTGVFVVHGWDRKRAMTCFDKEGLSEAQKDGSKVVIDSEVVMINDKDGKQVGFTFVDDSTALAILGPDAGSVASIKRVAAGSGHGLDTSAAFNDMYKKVNTKDSVWMLLNAQAPEFKKKMRGSGVDMKAVFGSLNVTDRLTVDARLRMSSADEANQLVTKAKGSLASPQIKMFFDKLDVTADLADVVIGVAMTDQQIAQLAGMLGMMTGTGGQP
jgi:hypothetical protein